jgi:hypothetical protein
MKKNRFAALSACLFFIIILFIQSAEAAITASQRSEFRLSDFASKYELDASADGRIYRLRLTPEVFKGLKSSYRRDLAAFDHGGAVLPFIVRDVDMPYSWEAAREKTSQASGMRIRVPFFAMPESGGGDASMLGITVKTGESGQIIAISGKRAQEKDSRRFLADLSGLADSDDITGYRLEVELGGETDVAAYADAYLSDNLSEWRKAASKAPLVRLTSGNDSLSSSFIGIDSPKPAKYLMLASDSPIIPENFFVSVIKRAEETRVEADSHDFAGRAEEGSRAVIYDTGGVFPVNGVNFALSAPGIYDAAVSSRLPGGDWRIEGNMKLSFIRNSSGESRNAIMPLRGSDGRYWRLEAPNGFPQPPGMRLFWHPKEIVFMAQGEGPYILALGSSENFGPLSNPGLISSALGQIGPADILEAKIARPIETAPGASEEDEPQKEASWPKYLVWCILTGAALLLSWIAWRLIRKDAGGKG